MKLNWLSKRVKTHQTRGFTLIELIIAISITVIIGGIILANYRTGQRQQALRAEAQKLVSTLRKAQNMALSGKDYQCPGETEATAHNYGVYLSTTNNEYKLFVDCDSQGDCNEANIDSYILETITLPSNISMSLNYLPDCYVFQRPDGSLYGDSGSINLTLGNYSRNVSIYKETGKIEITKLNCGNGICELGENCSSCLADCPCSSGYTCENGKCSPLY